MERSVENDTLILEWAVALCYGSLFMTTVPLKKEAGHAYRECPGVEGASAQN
jgi:hypothetical protein